MAHLFCKLVKTPSTPLKNLLIHWLLLQARLRRNLAFVSLAATSAGHTLTHEVVYILLSPDCRREYQLFLRTHMGESHLIQLKILVNRRKWQARLLLKINRLIKDFFLFFEGRQIYGHQLLMEESYKNKAKTRKFVTHICPPNMPLPHYYNNIWLHGIYMWQMGQTLSRTSL